VNTILRWSLFGVFVFVVSMALTVPAERGLAWLSLDDNIVVHGVSGRLLNGRAQQVIVNKNQFHQLTWSWRAQELLRGRLALDWIIEDPDITAKGIAMLLIAGQKQISKTTASISLAKLQIALPT